MKFFYHFIVWSSLGLVLGPLAWILFALWEMSQIPGLFAASITLDEVGE